jgi:hypothetical protein
VEHCDSPLDHCDSREEKFDTTVEYCQHSLGLSYRSGTLRQYIGAL